MVTVRPDMCSAAGMVASDGNWSRSVPRHETIGPWITATAATKDGHVCLEPSGRLLAEFQPR